MSTITPETVITAFIKSRTDIKALEDQIEVIKETQRKREEWLLSQLTKLGAQNLKTGAGTVYQTVKESVTVSDWDAVIDFAVVEPLVEAVSDYITAGGDPHASTAFLKETIKKNMRTEFLMKGVAKTAVLEYSGSQRENPFPPGVNYVATRTVGIRKS